MLEEILPGLRDEGNASSTVEAMKATKRWLIYEAVPRPGTDKVIKRPCYANGSPRGTTDTPADRANLVTLEDARKAVAARGKGWGLGFALGEDEHGNFWQGIDLDDVNENSLADLAEILPGYVERSPSGKGVHAIGYGRRFKTLGSNGSGVEAYSSGRYFTVTGMRVRDSAVTCLADIVEEHLALRHGTVSALATNPPPIVTLATVAPPQVVVELRSALNALYSDDYTLWVEIGLALKTFGAVGRGLWLDWSATSPKYDPQVAAEKWESFDPRQTSYRVVFAKAQAAGWINPASNAARLNQAAGDGPLRDDTAALAVISATPFIAPKLADIPPRPWLFGHWLMRGTVTTVIAPGGTGKSALMVAAALSLASGRELLGKTVWGDPRRVWLWNLEDDHDELARQVFAACLHHGLDPSDYADRLFVNGAESALCTATKGRDGLAIHEPVNAGLIAAIDARAIDVVIVDPFVSSHRAEENDNGQIDAVVKRWASIARDTGCSVVLVHHSRKLGGQQVDAEAARGASALGNAARSVLVLNRMDKSEAVNLGVGENDRSGYIRVSNDKSNRAPAGDADWFHIASVRLGNGGPAGGDSVGVIERWVPPNASTFVDTDTRQRVQAEIALGEWRAHVAANDWAGRAVANVIGVDPESPAGRHRAKGLLTTMLATGELVKESRKDSTRKVRDFIVPGRVAKNICDSPMW